MKKVAKNVIRADILNAEISFFFAPFYRDADWVRPELINKYQNSMDTYRLISVIYKHSKVYFD
jgi:hypothetical protein